MVRPLSIPKIQKATLATALVFTAISLLTLHYVVHFNWLVSVVDGMVNNIFLLLACIGLSNMMGYYQPKKERVMYVLSITLALTLIIIFLAKYLLLYFFSSADNYRSFYDFSLAFRGVLCFVFLAWCAMANILWYRLGEESEMRERLFTAQKLAKEAELNKLRHQLQPHFLFNSLNSVFALTMINPSEAGVMITKLASFLRGTLKRDDDIWVNVAEEMEYIQLYLDIEKVRFSHRLNLDINIDEDTLNLSLPGTLLQPIVENAIKFGLYNTSAKVTIKIDVVSIPNFLQITVQNPFDAEMKATGGTGFGLTSIKRRLYLLFADQNLLQTQAVDNNLYITILKIPQKNDQSSID
ncbi:sensor histidine kinase [Pedobacter changchengzhani]|uniref:Sensor histidine kinase n=1 Tax=Pedobacter changchengzhani TaxID=2529274 RepID=A0A4R5MJZ6_9SPHI|nr:histidine kinase [Pedobacter changchengzhani]TDG35868.1 sensor histidine kinase [Pedobacter changchengzhani]